jgi:hypothetical protein
MTDLTEEIPASGGVDQHDISTGVFGRAYLEIRAAYFTH